RVEVVDDLDWPLPAVAPRRLSHARAIHQNLPEDASANGQELSPPAPVLRSLSRQLQVGFVNQCRRLDRRLRVPPQLPRGETPHLVVDQRDDSGERAAISLAPLHEQQSDALLVHLQIPPGISSRERRLCQRVTPLVENSVIRSYAGSTDSGGSALPR